MSKLSKYRDFLQSVRSSIGFWKSYSLVQFTGSITQLMRHQRVSGKELASRLGISATQVSKVLRGNENVTIETMAKFADALDAVVHIHVARKGVLVQWEEMPSAGAERARMIDIENTGLNIVGEAFSESASLSQPVRVPLAVPGNTIGTQYLAVN